jgi:BON domain
LHVAKLFGRNVERQGRDVVNRAQGAAAEMNARVARDTVTDEVMAERVRSKIGRVVTHPRAIDVTAARGIVELRGAVLRSERRRAIRAAESIRGVRAVQHDALMTYSDEQRMPGYQPPIRIQKLKQAKPVRKTGSLRLGLALASGIIAGYKAFKRSSQPRPRRSETPASSSDIAA